MPPAAAAAWPLVPPALEALGTAVAWVGGTIAAMWAGDKLGTTLAQAQAAAKAKELAEKAKAEPKEIVDACSTCGDNDKKDPCKSLAESALSKGDVLSGRVADLLEDKLDLFNLAFDKPSPSLPKGSGSWKGHLHQAEGVKRGMRNDINAYDKAGCKSPKIPRHIRDLAYKKLPTTPL